MEVIPARSSRPRTIAEYHRREARSSSAPGCPSRPRWIPFVQCETPTADDEMPGPNSGLSPRAEFLTDLVMIDRFIESGHRKLRGWLSSYIEGRRGDLVRISPGSRTEPSPEEEQVMMDCKLASLPIPPGKPRVRRRRLENEEEEVESAQAKRCARLPPPSPRAIAKRYPPIIVE
ncbi:unnamed protein product [Colias eurytheme]|nr:unnamed protein product [Colias eurytheme]